MDSTPEKRPLREGIRRQYIDLEQLKGSLPCVWITSVYVYPTNRGKGRARQMLERFLAKHKKYHVLLEAWPFADKPVNPLKLTEFYQSLGFKRIRGFPANIMYRMPQI